MEQFTLRGRSPVSYSGLRNCFQRHVPKSFQLTSIHLQPRPESHIRYGLAGCHPALLALTVSPSCPSRITSVAACATNSREDLYIFFRRVRLHQQHITAFSTSNISSPYKTLSEYQAKCAYYVRCFHVWRCGASGDTAHYV